MFWMIMFWIVSASFAIYIVLDQRKKRKIVDQLCDQAEELDNITG